MKHTTKLLAVLSATALALCSVPGFGATAATVGDKLEVSSSGPQQKKEANVDGYSYEVWIDNKSPGTGSMTLGSGGTFQTEWSASGNQGNFLARRGRSYDTGKKATSYDTVVLNYDADYSASGGNSRLCVYGWYRDPLVEYYIIEDWVNWCPAQDTNNKKDSKIVKIDNAEYEIFWMYHTGPDINGQTSTFKQYYSVRQDKRKSGSITVTDHFKAWENAGWGIGSLYEIALNVEGWESSGSANVKKLTLTSTPDDDPVTTEPANPEPTVSYTAPTGKGSSISDNFETNSTLWEARGASSYGLTKDFYHGGSQSLYVTGREHSWHGFTAAGDELIAGHEYSFEAYTAINSTNYDSAGFTVGLQYDLDGKTNYKDITSASANSGKWAKLADEFTIPSGATGISLYVQTTYTENDQPSDLIPFFLDDVKLTDLSAGPVVTTTTPEPAVTTTTPTTVSSFITDGNPLLTSKTKVSIVVGGSDTVSFSYALVGTPSDLTFTVEDPTVAKIAYGGGASATVTGLKIGTTKVTVSDGQHYPVSFEVEVVQAATTTTEPAFKNFVYGDFDCNGEFEMADLIQIAKATAGIGTETSVQGVKNCDLNFSGKLDSADLTLALKLMSGMIDENYFARYNPPA